MADAVYRREGCVYHPTEWAGSPWSTAHQHGGPINALAAQALAQAALETGLQPVRLSVELLGPVPLAPLRLAWRLAHRSRRTALVDATLATSERPVARAHGQLLLAAAPGTRPRSWTQPETPLPGPEGLEGAPLMHRRYRDQAPPGFHFSFEVRMVPEQPAAWLTTPLDLVEGEPISDLERAAALADLASGLVGRTLLRQRLVDVDAPREMYINTDTHLQLERLPEGPWLGLERILLSDLDGIGTACVRLHDARGRFGTAQQSLLAR